MAHCQAGLQFEKSSWASSWGYGNARPLKAVATAAEAHCILLAVPPFTIRLRTTGEGLRILQVNAALVLYLETDSIVLPPATTAADGTTVPFYLDPPNRPGLHRDQFRIHAQKMIGGLLTVGFTLTPPLHATMHTTWATQVANYLQAASAAEAAARAAEAQRISDADAAEAQAAGMYVVEVILDERQRVNKKKRGGGTAAQTELEYLVQWTGYQEQTWEREWSLRKLQVLAEWKASAGSRAQPSTSST